VVWVYVICGPAAAARIEGAGLADAPLEAVREGELVAVVSHHAEPPDVSIGDVVLAQEEIVERLMEIAGGVLPMPFGARLPDVPALRSALADRHDELLAALDTVRGRVELDVRALRLRTVTPAKRRTYETGPGYLRARLELLDRDEMAAAAIHAPLAAMAVADSRHRKRAPRELLRASYLVERSAVGEFGTEARRLQREHTDLAILCTGPWPPYSFADVPALTHLH
jgi:Gas vesicle synthesis protein GvpL/GvpF